jgi:hypothetical protein
MNIEGNSFLKLFTLYADFTTFIENKILHLKYINTGDPINKIGFQDNSYYTQSEQDFDEHIKLAITMSKLDEEEREKKEGNVNQFTPKIRFIIDYMHK